MLNICHISSAQRKIIQNNYIESTSRNKEIEHKIFKMETLDSIIQLMRSDCYIASFNLSDE